MTDYQTFLESKRHTVSDSGVSVMPDAVHPKLFDWQKQIVLWALRKGRAAVFLDTGLGKTFIQLEWARILGHPALIVAPLSVARQTVREALKLGLEVRYVRGQGDVTPDHKLWITNYEMVESFDLSWFGSVVLDESSILKAIDGKTRKKLTSLCRQTPYKLCCTATPAPNDYTEIGNHAEFLGICTIPEMLATFFINANKEHTLQYGDETYRKKGSNKGGTEWRIKHHAEERFFEWLSSWAITMTKPSDLGYDDDGFILPELRLHPVFVETQYKGDQLFFTGLHGIADRADTRRSTLDKRMDALSIAISSPNSYNNSDEYTRDVSATLLQEAQGQEVRTGQGQGSQPHARTKGTTQGIHEAISAPEFRQVEANARSGAESKCAQAGVICERRISKVDSQGSSEDMAANASRDATQSETKALCDRSCLLFKSDGGTGDALRNLRDAIGQSEDISVCGSLPHNGQGQGIALRKLQSGDRQDDGQPLPASEGRTVHRDQWVIWCGLDAEQRAVEKLLGDDCLSIYGILPPDEKERRLLSWLDGERPFLVSKPRVCGFGLNLQQSHKMAFLGLNDSWETFYQAVRREWRYGQTDPVDVHIIMSDVEAEIYQNVMRKDAMAQRLRSKLIEQIRKYERRELGMSDDLTVDYTADTKRGDGWVAMLGDSCERLKDIPDNSIDMSVYSPPFADLFTYTASDRDLGNSRDWPEFFKHYDFIIREVLRVTKPGRLTCVHTSDIPALAQKDGYIGIKDFPGAVIKAYEQNGWILHGRCFVQKNPQAQAIRVKSKALLFVQMRKDSSDSRPALIDQILLFKKPGENAVPVTPVANGDMDNETWIEWAHGIWLGIRETETLQYSRARGADDEKHICPLQLGTIERCIKLYSNPGETVLTPFGGIGSEAYMALKLGRKAVLIELKPEYFNVAIQNLKAAQASRVDMFSMVPNGS